MTVRWTPSPPRPPARRSAGSWPWDDSEAPARHTNSAHRVDVALDDEGRPRPVPPVVAETPEEHRLFQEAEIRRQSRRARREAIRRLGTDVPAG